MSNINRNRILAAPPGDTRKMGQLFGTGIRHHSSLTSVIATIGGADADVSFAGAQGDFIGVVQVNVRVPHRLAGRGEIDVLLTVEPQIANPVRIIVK